MLESEGFRIGAQEQRAEWSDAAFSHRTHRKVINLLPGSFYLLSFDSLALTFPSKSYSSKCADLRLGYVRCKLLSCSLSLFPGVHCSLPVTEVAVLTLRLVSVPSKGIWGNRRMGLNYGPQRLMGVARFQENVQDVFLIRVTDRRGEREAVPLQLFYDTAEGQPGPCSSHSYCEKW